MHGTSSELCVVGGFGFNGCKPDYASRWLEG